MRPVCDVLSISVVEGGERGGQATHKGDDKGMRVRLTAAMETERAGTFFGWGRRGRGAWPKAPPPKLLLLLVLSSSRVGVRTFANLKSIDRRREEALYACVDVGRGDGVSGCGCWCVLVCVCFSARAWWGDGRRGGGEGWGGWTKSACPPSIHPPSSLHHHAMHRTATRTPRPIQGWARAHTQKEGRKGEGGVDRGEPSSDGGGGG